MKVLHLIGGGDIGGAKTHVLLLVKELSKHIDVKIIALRPGRFAEEAKEMGIDVEVVKTGNFFGDLKRVVNIIKSGGYEIIHSHGAKANMFSVAARRFADLPSITTVHSDYRLDYMHSVLKTMTFGMINSASLRLIDNYIAISRNFKQMLIRRGFDPENIFTLYNGMDFKSSPKEYSRQNLIEKYGISLKDDDILVGIAARLYPVKGIDILLNAAAMVIKKDSRVRFIIGGDGEDREKLEAQAAALGICDRVNFIGWLNDPYELMGVVDISVLTSLSESFAYSVLEGAKFRKATISSAVGGIPDLIESGVNGYLFEPGDFNQLSEYIVELASDAEKRRLFGEAIYEKASRFFSLENMCATQLGIYKKVKERFMPAKHDRSKHDVVISGYYGFHNIGDDALLMAIISNLRELQPGIKMLVLSQNPMETRLVYEVNSVNRLNMLNVFNALRKAKLFIYGGGNIIQDNTSTRSLFFYLGTTWFAKRMGLKVMLYGNGIGPLKKKRNRKLTSRIINEVDVITLREELSIDELKALGIIKPRICLTADPAVAVSHDENIIKEKDLVKYGIDAKGPFAGISVRKYPGHEAYKHEDYEDKLACMADYLIEKHGLTPVFIPMQHPVDLEIIKNVVSKMKGKGYIIKNNNRVADTLGIISNMEILIGMRLHALIFAASLGIPVIGLVYDEPKIEGFLRCIGQTSAGHVKNLDSERLTSIIDYTLSGREQISERLLHEIENLREKSLENARIAIDLLNK